MKKILTFICLVVITIFIIGVTDIKSNAISSNKNNKFIENPYLLTDDEGNVIEIPMYIMNSITTTFPDYFDYEAAIGTEFEDKNWGGTVRQYAWNGVKIVVPQFNAEGATGKYYGLYPYGASKGGEVGFGSEIYTTSGTYDKGTFYKRVVNNSGVSSLSFYLFNDQDADWSMESINKADNASPYIIFDGEGKAIAGLVLPDTGANAVEAAYGLGQEFCWDENGVGVVANNNVSNCRTNYLGNPDYITYRYVWQYMEEKPANLNNGYLNEGWRADNWDFYNEETKVAVTILSSSFANGGAVSTAELLADETIGVGHIRAPFNETVIPAGGLLYKFGYLERTSTLLPLFKEVQAQAYLYGRDEAYSQYVKCYNYIKEEVKIKEDVLEKYGLNILEGTNTIEIPMGQEFPLYELFDLSGMTYYFADENNPFSCQTASLTDEKALAKFNSIVEEEKLLLREEVAYEAYQKWLDEQAAEEAKLIAAKSSAKKTLDLTKDTKTAIEYEAQVEVLAMYPSLSSDPTALMKFVSQHLASNEEYKKAVVNYNNALAAYGAASEALGNPTYYEDLNGDGDTKDSGETIQATGFYVEYEATVNEVEANIAEKAKERAKVEYDKWYNGVYLENIALNIKVTENNKSIVYKSEYKTKADISKVFLTDFQTWAEYVSEEGKFVIANYSGNDSANEIIYGWPEFLKASIDYYTTGSLYDETKFWSKEMIAKWSWLLEYITVFSDNASNKATVQQLLNKHNVAGYTPIRSAMEVFAFLNDTSWATWKAANAEAAAFVSTGWLPGSADYSDAKGQQWKPKTWNYDDPITPDVNEIYVLRPSNVINGRQKISISINNYQMDMSEYIDIDFITIYNNQSYTPTLEIQYDTKYISNINNIVSTIKSMAVAYNKIYNDTNGLEETDISDKIVFEYPALNEDILQGTVNGRYPIRISVKNDEGNKKVVKYAYVVIESANKTTTFSSSTKGRYKITLEESNIVSDVDANNVVNTEDVVYLLMHTYFPTEYQINGNCDYDINNKIDTEDVIYLLMNTYFPEDYPIE